jgi:Tol biopolymer transport system component
MYDTRESIFEVAITPEGDVILAKGSVISSRLFVIKRPTKTIELMADIPGSVRYPALSGDGTQLAFSRRERGSWHLQVRDLRTGAERQLTDGACNALSPSWANGSTLLYATDCGRGLGLSAIAQVMLPN